MADRGLPWFAWAGFAVGAVLCLLLIVVLVCVFRNGTVDDDDDVDSKQRHNPERKTAEAALKPDSHYATSFRQQDPNDALYMAVDDIPKQQDQEYMSVRDEPEIYTLLPS